MSGKERKKELVTYSPVTGRRIIMEDSKNSDRVLRSRQDDRIEIDKEMKGRCRSSLVGDSLGGKTVGEVWSGNKKNDSGVKNTEKIAEPKGVTDSNKSGNKGEQTKIKPRLDTDTDDSEADELNETMINFDDDMENEENDGYVPEQNLGDSNERGECSNEIKEGKKTGQISQVANITQNKINQKQVVWGAEPANEHEIVDKDRVIRENWEDDNLGGEKNVIDEKKEENSDEQTKCTICMKSLAHSKTDYIMCDGGCEKWFHCKCVGIGKKEFKMINDNAKNIL